MREPRDKIAESVASVFIIAAVDAKIGPHLFYVTRGKGEIRS